MESSGFTCGGTKYKGTGSVLIVMHMLRSEHRTCTLSIYLALSFTSPEVV